MAKKILIINGHPDKESFNYALSRSYAEGAKKAGAKVETINVTELEFEPNLKFGYKKEIPLEIDLQKSTEKLQNSDHIVVIYPIWWGSSPAILKGFIDRVFLPEIFFSYDKNNAKNMLLVGKSAHIIETMGQPLAYYKFVLGKIGFKQFKKVIFDFCGLKKVSHTCFGSVDISNEQQRKKWLEKVNKLGFKDAKN